MAFLTKKRFLKLLILFVFTTVVVRAGVNLGVGFMLRKVFQNGTQCRVSFEAPWVTFFPVAGSIDNVSIVHESEQGKPGRPGFYADRISVRLDLLALLSRTVRLSNLRLDGAVATTESAESGFFNTMAFLFGGSTEPPSKRKSKWRIVVHDVTIRPPADAARSQNFNIAFKGNNFNWTDFSFDSSDPSGEPEDPVLMKASASSFSLTSDGVAVPFSKMEAEADVLRGRISLSKGSLLTLDSSVSGANAEHGEITAVGKIITTPVPPEENLALEVKGKLLGSELGLMFPKLGSYATEGDGSFVFGGLVSGDFLYPKADGMIQVNLGKPIKLIPTTSCELTSVSGKVSISPDQVRVYNLGSQEFLHDAWFSLERGSSIPSKLHFRSGGALNLEPEGQFARCILDESADMDSEEVLRRGKIQTIFKQALSGSESSWVANGTLDPVDVQFHMQSEFGLNDPNESSATKVDLAYQADQLKIAFSERGLNPQIQRETPVVSSTDVQTPIVRALNSIVDAELKIDLRNRSMLIDRLEITRYPATRLIARIALFMDERSFGLLSLFPTRGSLIDARLKGSGGMGASAQGECNFSVGDLNIGGLSPGLLEGKLLFQGAKVQAPMIRLRTEAGELVSKGSIDFAGSSGVEAGKIQLSGSTSSVELEKVLVLQRLLPRLSGTGEADFSIAGTVGSPQYQANATFQTRIGSAAASQTSKIDLKGDSSSLIVQGDLLAGSGKFELRYPFDSTVSENLIVDAALNDFSLAPFFPEPQDQALSDAAELKEPREKPGVSAITAALKYSGPRANPLAGQGSIEVKRLEINEGQLQIQQQTPIRASIADGRLNMSDVRLLTKGRKMTVHGFVDAMDGYNITLKGDLELSSVFGVSNWAEQISGGLAIELNITGPLEEPELVGNMSLEGGAISFPLGRSVIGLYAVKGQAIFKDDRITISELRGSMGEGEISGVGLIENPLSPAERQTTFELNLSDISAEPISKFSVAADGKLGISQYGEAPWKLKGDIIVTNALYENTVNLIDVIRSITSVLVGRRAEQGRASTAKVREGPSKLELDLNIESNNTTLVETNILEAELRGKLHVFGGADRPAIDGEISATNGEFGFQQNRFELLTGLVSFDSRKPQADPRLDIIGETAVSSRDRETHSVRIAISGTLLKPQVKFYSDSGLSERQIASLLGLGADLNKLTRRETRSEDRRTMGDLLSPTSDVSLGERLHRLTGVSEVRVDTVTSTFSGEVTPRLVARRPLLRKLSAEFDAQLGGERESSASVEYPLTNSVNFSSGWTNYSVTQSGRGSGALQAGVVYRRSLPGTRLFPSLWGWSTHQADSPPDEVEE